MTGTAPGDYFGSFVKIGMIRNRRPATTSSAMVDFDILEDLKTWGIATRLVRAKEKGVWEGLWFRNVSEMVFGVGGDEEELFCEFSNDGSLGKILEAYTWCKSLGDRLS